VDDIARSGAIVQRSRPYLRSERFFARGASDGTRTRFSGSVAGPWITAPSCANTEPWHGQSQVESALFQVMEHPMCVHAAEKACSVPLSVR